ncbi:MAG: hypothetical protein ACR2LX_06320 [Jatrophihabitans sp.]
MDYRVSAQERAAFKRCRRQWDFGAAPRQNLLAVEASSPDLNDAVRDALAVYYYPGMWDWQSLIVLPLVRKAFMRTMAAAPPSPQRTADVDAGTELLERYIEWAPSVDDFSPLMIETDVASLVPDIRAADQALVSDDGQRVLYTDRIELVVIDAADEIWLVTHQVVPEWRDVESLLLDEAAIAGCWAWEHEYLARGVAGTIHNEILGSPPDALGLAPTATRTGRTGRGGYSQNEASGGGRSIPQLARPERVEARPEIDERVHQETAGILRRTRIRRSREEVETSRQQVGAEVLAMLDPALAVYPAPSPAHCARCLFVAPCLTMSEGGDPALDLASRYRRGSDTPSYEPRLGASGGGARYVPIPPPGRG